MTKKDRAALTLALEQCRAEKGVHAEQIADKLRDDGFEEFCQCPLYPRKRTFPSHR